MTKGRASIVWLALVLASFTLFVGCDNSLEPFDDDAGLFSVYGYLTLSQEPHFLRIRDLNEPVKEGATRTLDATVTLENLETGTTEILTDSIVVFEGVYTHNFRTDLDIQPATTYRVTVERPDGQTSQATATMPHLTDVEVEPGGTVNCTQQVFLHFRNVPEERLLRVSVGFAWRNHLNWVDLGTPTVGDRGTPFYAFNPATILEGVFPERIQATVGQDPARFCNLLDDDKFRVAYTHYGPDWPADSVLADPLASNVENGLGVFGGLRRDTLIVPVDRAE